MRLISDKLAKKYGFSCVTPLGHPRLTDKLHRYIYSYVYIVGWLGLPLEDYLTKT